MKNETKMQKQDTRDTKITKSKANLWKTHVTETKNIQKTVDPQVTPSAPVGGHDVTSRRVGRPGGAPGAGARGARGGCAEKENCFEYRPISGMYENRFMRACSLAPNT